MVSILLHPFGEDPRRLIFAASHKVIPKIQIANFVVMPRYCAAFPIILVPKVECPYESVPAQALPILRVLNPKYLIFVSCALSQPIGTQPQLRLLVLSPNDDIVVKGATGERRFVLPA